MKCTRIESLENRFKHIDHLRFKAVVFRSRYRLRSRYKRYERSITPLSHIRSGYFYKSNVIRRRRNGAATTLISSLRRARNRHHMATLEYLSHFDRIDMKRYRK